LKGGELVKCYSLDKYKKYDLQENNGVTTYRLSKEDINDYLNSTYTKEELDFTKISEPTFLDVIGYTLDEDGFETVEGKYYELEEIEALMHEKWDSEDEDA
jgi:hypothetical protein